MNKNFGWIVKKTVLALVFLFLFSGLVWNAGATVVENYAESEVSGNNAQAEIKIKSTVDGETYTLESSSPGKYKLQIKSVEGEKPAVTIESEAISNIEGVVKGIEKEAKEKIKKGSNELEKEIEERNREMKLPIRERVEEVFLNVVSFFKNLFRF